METDTYTAWLAAHHKSMLIFKQFTVLASRFSECELIGNNMNQCARSCTIFFVRRTDRAHWRRWLLHPYCEWYNENCVEITVWALRTHADKDILILILGNDVAFRVDILTRHYLYSENTIINVQPRKEKSSNSQTYAHILAEDMKCRSEVEKSIRETAHTVDCVQHKRNLSELLKGKLWTNNAIAEMRQMCGISLLNMHYTLKWVFNRYFECVNAGIRKKCIKAMTMNTSVFAAPPVVTQ